VHVKAKEEMIQQVQVNDEISAGAAQDEVEQQNFCPDDSFFNEVVLPGDEAKSACGAAVWGKLMIGVDSAEGLADADAFWGGGTSDPFTRLRFLSGSQNVFDEMSTAVLNDNTNPTWREMFTIDFKCPQMPTQDDFKLEVAVRDSDSFRGDNMLGMTTLTIGEMITIQGSKTIDLSVSKGEYKYSQGNLNMFFWFCMEGDADCEQQRQTAQDARSWAMKEVQSSDCYMGCDRVLRSGLSGAIDQAAKNVNRALIVHAREEDQRSAGERYMEKLERVMRETLTISYNRTIVDSNMKRMLNIKNKLDSSMAERASSEKEKEKVWAELQRPAQEFAAEFKTITTRMNVCSSGSKVEELMEMISEPLRNFVSNPGSSGFDSSFDREKAQGLSNQFAGLKSSLSGLQTCLRTKWSSKKLILNAAKTSPQCEKLFNED